MRGRKNKWILIGIVYWESSSRLRSFVTKSKGQSNSKDIPVSEAKWLSQQAYFE